MLYYCGIILMKFNYKEKITNLNRNFDVLFNELKKIRNRLDSTPSIYPTKGYVTSEFG